MRFTRIATILVLIVAAFAGGIGFARFYMKGDNASAGKGGRKILYYIDPMHPSYKSDKPGIAPDCGMKLEPVYEDGGAASAPAQKGKILHYRDPQNPDYKSDKPGLNPETGNELEPVYENDASSMPMGTISISPDKQQLIGVRYANVEQSAGTHSFRAVAKVAYDETRIARVQTKVEGWIEKVFVDFTGKLVEKGQPLLTLYSPELLATQQEYLLALRSREILKDSPLRNSRTDADGIVNASRRRLELWDISEAQLDEIARTQKPTTNMTLYSPISGYVVTRNAFPKQRITPETELYTVVDLSRVWIMADVFENEAAMVKLGQHVVVNVSYIPGRTFHARVAYIQPQVDPTTRTLKIRLEADNPDLVLKPDMFVDVRFEVPMPSRITVPSEAVLNAGLRKTVFVDRGNGFLEPRQVEIGERVGNRLEIRSGLKPGERVVTSGNFLIDSESQLKAAAGGMAGHQHGAAPAGDSKPSPTGAGHEGHGAAPNMNQQGATAAAGANQRPANVGQQPQRKDAAGPGAEHKHD